MGKFESYNELSTGADDDLLLVLDDSASETKYITLANILAYVLSKTLTSPYLNEAVALTTTSTELNQLHSQGAVAADFAKLAAIAASATEIDNACKDTLSRTSVNQSGLTINSVYSEQVELDLGSVTSGSLFLVFVRVSGTKGGTAGEIRVATEKKSGTATVNFQGSIANPTDFIYIGAGDPVGLNFCVLMNVTGSGTLILRVQASSSGSDVTSGIVDLVAVPIKVA